MEFVRDKNSNIVFGLHDSRINQIILQGNTVVLKVDKIFGYVDGDTKIYFGDIVFHDCDLEECRVLIFNQIIDEEEFSGRVVGIQAFAEEYTHLEFEILTEGYCGYYTTYSG